MAKSGMKVHPKSEKTRFMEPIELLELVGSRVNNAGGCGRWVPRSPVQVAGQSPNSKAWVHFQKDAFDHVIQPPTAI